MQAFQHVDLLKYQHYADPLTLFSEEDRMWCLPRIPRNLPAPSTLDEVLIFPPQSPAVKIMRHPMVHMHLIVRSHTVQIPP